MASETSGMGIVLGAWRVLAATLLATGALTAQAVPVTTQGTWYGTDGTNGTLRARDSAGNPLASVTDPNAKYFYDTQLDLTWLGDWNVNGAKDWAAANAWAASLTDFGGGWSLPGVLDTGTPGCVGTHFSGAECGWNVYGSEAARRDSPLAHMFYDTLGNLALYDTSGNVQTGWGLSNTGPFSNMQSLIYWSGTEYAPDRRLAWYFATNIGNQSDTYKYGSYYAVAVRSGDVAAVPEPRSVVLALLGLAVLWVVRRRRAG